MKHSLACDEINVCDQMTAKYQPPITFLRYVETANTLLLSNVPYQFENKRYVLYEN